MKQCLVAIEEIRSAKTPAHENRVGNLCSVLCSTMGLEPDFANKLEYAASLHDIGKAVLPDTIVNKPGKLDAAVLAAVRSNSELVRRTHDRSRA